VEHLLAASPASIVGISLLCEALQVIAAEWPKERPLRVLEIGATGGAATRRVLDCLAQSDVALSYVATSSDAEQTARLSFLAEVFTGVSARQWSPQDGMEGFGRASFDIILAVNACALLQLDATSLAQLRELVAPGGIFIAVEPEPNTLWEIVFGQNSAWWLPDTRGGFASPLRSAEEWRAEFAAAGFHSAGAASCVGVPWPCVLLWGSAAAQQGPADAASTEPRRFLIAAGNTALATALRNNLSDLGHRVTVIDHADQVRERDLDQDGGDGKPETIIFLAEEPSPDRPIDCAAQQIAALARIATDLANRRAALWVVTCDAQQAAPADDRVGATGAAL
jgi:SAM-dependent methyltransferase